MKTAALLLLMATVANAAEYRPQILPPEEYDRPYKGHIIMVRPETMEETAKLCGNAKTNLGYMLACSYQWGDTLCRIIMAPNDEITKRGHKPEWVLRHEIGHCNNWPADHRGARRPE